MLLDSNVKYNNYYLTGYIHLKTIVSCTPMSTCYAGNIGKAAQCQQKVCSSKRPPKLEPRSVRPNEVFENLACRIPLNNRELVKAEVFEKRVFKQTTPFKLRNEGGIFLEQPFGRNCVAS